MNRRISKPTADEALREAKKLGKAVYRWDTTVACFGLVATPPSIRHKKGHCVFLFQYRSPEKRDKQGSPKGRKMQLGIYGQGTTPDQARKKAEKCRGLLADRIDPQEERDRDQAHREGDITVTELCDKYLVEAPHIVIPSKKRPKKASTLEIDRSNIKRHIKPLIGHLSIREVTSGDIEQMQADISAGKTACDEKTGHRGRAIVRGGPGIAGRCVALLGGIFTFAVRKRWVEASPVKGVALLQLEDRTRYLKGDELGRLGSALVELKEEGFNSQAIAAVRLLIFTGARKGEIIGLKWSDIDFELGLANLPDSKTGKKSIPLAAPALELLQSLPRIGEYVLPGTDSSKPYQGLQKAWGKIKARAKINDLRIHDLRHSFATISAAGGDSLFLIGKVLGHAHSRTTERYAHADIDPIKAVAERTAKRIESAMKAGGGKTASDRRNG